MVRTKPKTFLYSLSRVVNFYTANIQRKTNTNQIKTKIFFNLKLF